MTSGVQRLGTSDNNESNCGGCCNGQLCTSYLLGLLACFLVVGGVFLAFHRWDYMWLAVSVVGILLILVGAVLHYCGSRRNRRRCGNNKRGSRPDLGHSEQLLPSAPTLSSAYSVSQLSLNMLPPYFPAYDTMSIATQPDGSISASQIMQINGQSFLLLPLNEGMAETQSLANRLSVQLVQAPLEPSSVFNNHKRPTMSDILQPGNFPTQPATAPTYSYPLQVGLPLVKDNCPHTTITSEMQQSEDHLFNYVPETEPDFETPAYLSLEPTYESIVDPRSDPDIEEEVLGNSGISAENVPNLEMQVTDEQIGELNSIVLQFEENCEPSIPVTDNQVPCPNEQTEENPEPEELVSDLQPPVLNIEDGLSNLDRGGTSQESAMERDRALEELNIPNPSPRSITPEPDQMSSPPPSYDEVAHIAIGAFGVAYGTI